MSTVVINKSIVTACEETLGKNSKVFAFLTLGTGIGGALLINGVLFGLENI